MLLLRWQKLYKNILVYDVSCETFIGAKPLRFDKVDGFIKGYDGISYLILFVPETYDAIYKRIRYLINQKSGICSFSQLCKNPN